MGISPQQFEQLKARLDRPRSRTGMEAFPLVERTRTHGVILGIDPSLRRTGWGILDVSTPSAPVALAWGSLPCPPALPRSRCLARIAAGLREALRQFQPTACAVEGLFHARNLRTALIMGEARGVCLLVAAEAGLEIAEIAPRKVKQAIVGFGGAGKPAVARMIQRMLRLEEVPEPDAADALAIALAHAHELARPWSSRRAL